MSPPCHLGRIVNGKEIIFDHPGGSVQDMALYYFCDQPQAIPGDPFYMWGAEVQDRIDSGARFAGLSGQVEVRPDFDEDAWDFAQLKMVLYTEDHIRTGPRSGAIISFKDLKTFVMKADTEIVLATPPEKESKLELVAGNIWVNVKKMIKDGTMEVTMNQAVSGIKGTILICEETGTTSSVKVIEGSVEFRDNFGKSVIVSSGEKASATGSGMMEKETFDLEAEKEAWAELVESEAMAAAETEASAGVVQDSGGLGNLPFIAGAAAVVLLAGVLLMILKSRKRK